MKDEILNENFDKDEYKNFFEKIILENILEIALWIRSCGEIYHLSLFLSNLLNSKGKKNYYF
jgi:hypothetical protein